MRKIIFLTILAALSGCGVETMGAAATTAKLQADQAKQAKENLDNFKTKLDEANKATAESAKRADEGADEAAQNE